MTGGWFRILLNNSRLGRFSYQDGLLGLDMGISICWVIYRRRVLSWGKLYMRKKLERSTLELVPAIAKADLYDLLKYPC
jgi:hypothetical protein